MTLLNIQGIATAALSRYSKWLWEPVSSGASGSFRKMEAVSKWNVADMPIRILSIKKAVDMFSTGHKLPSIDQP